MDVVMMINQPIRSGDPKITCDGESLFVYKSTGGGVESCSRSCIDHFTRCKQHWSRSTSCFSLYTL